VLPAGLSWGDYVEGWVADCGGWSPLADRLVDRAGVACDIATVERGLRRLATRGHKPGGRYGRWMLRYLGAPSHEAQVRWLGADHSRFADLPAGTCLEHLALWNRPPVAESRLAPWIEVGLASASYRRLDGEATARWLARAERRAPAAGPAAVAEVNLVRAQLEVDAGEPSLRRCDAIEAKLAFVSDASYHARLQHLRAMCYTRGRSVDVRRARACYEAIPEAGDSFVAARKRIGLAYCAWKLGDDDEAVALANRALDDAGDGGFVRVRVAALNLMTRLAPTRDAAALNARARRMAIALDDDELLRRVQHCTP
jgi:hypothetical protein